MEPDRSGNGGLPSGGLDELMRLQKSMEERGGGNGNITYDDFAASTGAFSNFMMNNNVALAASGNATNFNTAHGGGSFSGGHAIMTSGTSHNNQHGTSLINAPIFEVKTGEPTPNVMQASQFKPIANYGGNDSEAMARTSSEPMLAGMMPVMDSIGGAGFARNQAGNSVINSSNNMTGDSSAMQRRKSAPASNMLDDVVFDQLQLYNEGGPSTGEQEDIFADGYHSPPLRTTSPVAETKPSLTLGENRPRYKRRNTEPPNWDLFDAPSPIPMDEKATLFRNPFDATDEPGRSSQQKTNTVKRSLSADPLLMHSTTANNISHPSDDHKTNDSIDIFNYLNPEERLHLEKLGIYSREKPKRRRSAPVPTEEILFELGERGTNEYREDKGLPSSFSAHAMSDDDALVETSSNRQTSDLMQMIMGMKNVDSVGADVAGTASIPQTTNAFPGLDVSQINQYLPTNQVGPISTQQMHMQPSSSNNCDMNFNPMYTSQPMQQSINVPHPAQNDGLSAFSGHQNMMPLQQSPVDPLKPNTPSINENELANILDAVTETHNNLQLLQSAVDRFKDPVAVESITKAFELTAACSQFALLTQYDAAHNTLNQAWSHIKIVETRLSSSDATSLDDSNRSDSMLPFSDFNDKPLCLPQKSKSKKKKTAKTLKTKANKSAELPPQSKDDPEVIMTRLKALMERTVMSQRNLQKYDKQNGLPRSHAQTMINTSRSRKQLQKGVVSKNVDVFRGGGELSFISNQQQVLNNLDVFRGGKDGEFQLAGNPPIPNQQVGASSTQNETSGTLSSEQTPAWR